MAKKKKTGGEFNMAAEIRSLLEENRSLTGSETLALIQKKHPKAKLNKNSFGVAFYGARNKLGISSKRRSKKKRQTGQKKVVVRRTPAKTDMAVDIATLQQADEGLIEFNGINVQSNPHQIRLGLGYLPQDFDVYPHISVYDLLDHLAILKGIANKKARQESVEGLLAQTNLWKDRKKAVSTFSGVDGGSEGHRQGGL